MGEVSASGFNGPVVFVHNPDSGSAVDADRAAECLRAVGIEVGERLAVKELAALPPQGARWREAGYAGVIVAGGDGTLGALATHLAGSGLPLGILPRGTSNDVARFFGLPFTLVEACAAIARGAPVPVDLGRVFGADGEGCFLHALSLGLNVEFARLATDIAQRRRWGNLNYAASALGALSRFEAVPITLTLFEAAGHEGPLEISCQAAMLQVVNIPLFGGRREVLLPGSDPTDRLLDFVLIEAPAASHFGEIAEYLLGVLGRDPASLGKVLPGVRRFQARAAALETGRPVELALDGEIACRTPARIDLVPEPLLIYLPPEARAEIEAEAGAPPP
jgi:diacylglycerol kinase (ATP)